MSDLMPRDEYELYQRKIGEICLQMGLVEKRTHDYIEYCTELDTDFVYGEVIRMFDWEYSYNNSVVFFNKLVRSTLSEQNPNDTFKYIFDNYHKELPFETEDNSISFSEPLEQILDKVKYIVSNAIKQRKELDVKVKLEKMKVDFKWIIWMTILLMI